MGGRRRLSKTLTPNLILLLFAFHQLFCSAEQDLGFRRRERSALLKFKEAVTADPAGLLSDWTDDSASDHCSWRGVTCDSRTKVSGVNISAVGGFRSYACHFPQTDPFRDGRCSDLETRLRGRIPPTISEIKGLKVLALPFHDFEGGVRKEIFELEELEVVDLQGNGLSGALPSMFGPRLRVVRLGFNSFSGEIPKALSNCADLEVLDLSHNGVNGTIPPFFGKLSKLKILSLSFNELSGAIPDGIGIGCSSLEHLELSGNFLTGGIPGSLGNCSKLQNLILFSNLLEDVIPADLGQLRKLRVLDVSRNSLSGPLPAELGNCFELTVLVLSDAYSPLKYRDEDGQSSEFNRFQRGIPPNFTTMPNLRILWAPRASLEGMFPSGWGACRSLEIVNLGENILMGEMPSVLGQCRYLKYLNVSSNKLTGWLNKELHVPCMDVLDVSGNQLSGSLPMFAHSRCPSSQFTPYDISSAYSSFFKNMAITLSAPTLYWSALDVTILHDFSENNFTGDFPSLPIAAGRLGERTVYALLIDGNKITGTFPGTFVDKCKLLNGLILNISGNNVTGMVPADINKLCGSLLVLDAAGNQITGAIPPRLGLLGSLVGIDLSRNKLIGRIPPSFSLLKSLRYLSLASNNLSGVVPSSLSQMHALEVLDLSSNSFSGKIPSDLLKLGNLSVLLLNNNTISGRIPPLLANNTSLSTFDVSFNNLSGPIPLGGVTVRCESVIGNPRLDSCPLVSLSVPPADVQGPGGGSMSYAASPPANSSSRGSSTGFTSIEIASIASATAIVSVLLALIFIYIYTRKCASRSAVQASGRKEVTVFTDIGVPVTYDSVVHAARGFNTSNCIGSGGFGATYKAEIAPGVVVAVKRLAVGRIQGVQQFHAEVKTLGRWRHPNLVTLIGFHVSETEMFLIYNYLPGGNLERFIQDRSRRPVDWRMLHKIALDVARALAYLHDHCVPRILHRDVKPSNILLDNEYNGYLSDFGLARLLGNSETHATTGVAGTFGYVAPEYAMTCRVSDKADVYSYGVVLLELISNKKALDPSFSPYGNGFNIVAWAQMLLRKGQAREFFTEGLWDVGPHDDLVDTLHLGITCTDDSLSTRPTMKYVVQRLKQIQPPMCSPITH